MGDSLSHLDDLLVLGNCSTRSRLRLASNVECFHVMSRRPSWCP